MTSTTDQAARKPRAEDVASPDTIIKAVYEALSGPAGKRNWQRLRSLYLPGARLIPIGNRVHAEGRTDVMSVDEWIDDISAYFEEHPFYIREIQRHADRFQGVQFDWYPFVRDGQEFPLPARRAMPVAEIFIQAADGSADGRRAGLLVGIGIADHQRYQ